MKFFSIYTDIAAALFETLTDEQLGRFLRLCVMYTSEAPAEELAAVVGEDKALAVAWTMYKATLDRDAEKYREKCEKARAAIKKRWEKIQPNTDAYERIQPNTDAYYNNNYNYNNNEVCVDTPRARTREEWCELFTGDRYSHYREALAITWRVLSADQVTECCRRAIAWADSAGKPLNEATLKHYINKECELLAQKPAGTMEKRRQAFHEECKKLLELTDDRRLVSQFFAEYSQPCNGQHAGLMLFESMRAWDTVTRFKLYIKENGNK